MDSTKRTQKKSQFFKVRTGCWTCRARRLKCDETKPYCRSCTKSGLECKGLGYAAGIHTFRPYRVVIYAAPTNLAQLNASTSVLDIVNLGPVMRNLLKNGRVADFATYNLRTHLRIQSSLQVYMTFLPSRAGYSSALDSATRCVAAALQVIYSTSRGSTFCTLKDLPSQHWSHILPLYSTALKHLQLSLGSKQSASAETLCAALLLCYFETLRGVSEEDTARHIDGVMALISHRGPQAFQTDFEKALLKSQVALVAPRVVATGQKSVFCSDEWTSILQSTIVDDKCSIENGDRTTEYMIHSLALLDIRIDTRQLILANDNLTPSIGSTEIEQHIESRRKKILARLIIFRQRLADWILAFENEEIIPHSQLSSKLEQDQAEFYSDERQLIKQICRISLLQMNRIYIALGGDDSYHVEKEVQKSAANLLALLSSGQKLVNRPITEFFISNTCNGILGTAEEWLKFSALNTGRLVSWKMLSRFFQLARVNWGSEDIKEET